jgi:hypothetical protein
MRAFLSCAQAGGEGWQGKITKLSLTGKVLED